MAVLRNGLLRAGWVVPAALLLLAGCVLIDALSPERRFAFSHELHVGQEGLDCTGCHESAQMEEQPGMPAPDTCAVCHEELDEVAPPGRRVGEMFVEEEFVAARVSALADEVIFSHRSHAVREEDCGACHEGISENERLDADDAVLMDACVACHAARGAPSECADCHTRVDREWAPASHDRDWTRFHGPVSRSACPLTADRCDTCHTEASCASCHLEEAPRSHDNHFRRRGHGVLARIDRASCTTCHRSDSCDACHMEALPSTHRGNWGGTRSTHCLGCHFPLAGEGCTACHRSTPSHSLGTPKPPGHHPAMNCRACHGLTQPLPHVDKGDDCNQCHP